MVKYIVDWEHFRNRFLLKTSVGKLEEKLVNAFLYEKYVLSMKKLFY